MASNREDQSPLEACSYRGQRVALLTQHGKERLLAPKLEPVLGCTLHHVTGFDTDLLGTFTRDIPRDGSQLEAARRKARIGMELSGLRLGLASEGSFGPDPFMGLLPWNLELLIFIDDERDLEIVGMAQGNANSGHLLTADWEAAEAFANKLDFPRHHLVVRPASQNDPHIRKGIKTWNELRAAFVSAQSQAANGQVFLETDSRAHANPTRQQHIRLAGEDLIRKVSSLCPQCGTPGFWRVERLAGLRCADCGAPTRETKAEVLGCIKCEHRLTQELANEGFADPGRCDYCNP